MVAWEPGNPTTQAILLDPRTTFLTSGVLDGWNVWLTGETAQLPSTAAIHVTRQAALAGTLTVLEGEQAGAVFGLVAGENLFGRQREANTNCQVPFTARSVSREHAKLTITADARGQILECQLTDLGSVNGTWVAGKRVPSEIKAAIPLRSGNSPRRAPAARLFVAEPIGGGVDAVSVTSAQATDNSLIADNSLMAGSALLADSVQAAGTKLPLVANQVVTLGDVRVRIQVFARLAGSSAGGFGGANAEMSARAGAGPGAHRAALRGEPGDSQVVSQVSALSRVQSDEQSCLQSGAATGGALTARIRREQSVKNTSTNNVASMLSRSPVNGTLRLLRKKFMGALPVLPPLRFPALPQPPTGIGLGQQLQGLLVPLVCGLGMLAFSHSPAALMFVFLTPCGLLLVLGIEALRRGRARKQARQKFFAELAKCRAENASAQAGFRQKLQELYPSLAKLLRLPERLWEYPPAVVAGGGGWDVFDSASASGTASASWNTAGAAPAGGDGHWLWTGSESSCPALRLGVATLNAPLTQQEAQITPLLPAGGGKKYERLKRECEEALAELRKQAKNLRDMPCVVPTKTIGVWGTQERRCGYVRALTLWLALRLPPAQLRIVALTEQENRKEWEWLLWLPHCAAKDYCALPQRGENNWNALFAACRARLDGDAAGGGAATVPASAAGAQTNFGSAGSRQASTGSIGAGEETQWLILIIDTPNLDSAELATLCALAKAESARVTLIWLSENEAELPGICHTSISWSTAGKARMRTAGQPEVELRQVESLAAAAAEHLARRLAPWRDAAQADDAEALPAQVSLAAVHPTDLRGGSAAVGEAWLMSDSLPAKWKAGEPRRACPLRVPLGRSTEGVFHIDLRRQGPHALLAGTTGAGKSEFLQTWLMSLAATLSPARLTFLLVDYKGGAAFAECGQLPHTVGLVSDLTPALAQRALISLRAELRFRERVLAKFSCKDVLEMESQGIAETPPVLLLVVDEFAALSREIPDFVTGILDVAQRGRSLGIHLILATQRPAGVVSDSIRANTNLRIALRVADAADSRDVVGSALAAEFSVTQPGRAIVRCGSAPGTVMQTAYVGGAAISDNTEVIITRLDGEGISERRHSTPGSNKHIANTSESLLQRMCKNISAAATQLQLPPPRPPWLPPLPPAISLTFDSELCPRLAEDRTAAQAESGEQLSFTQGTFQTHEASPTSLADWDSAENMFGVLDLPAKQQQIPLTLSLDSGNLALIGASGTGKTTALRTIAAAVSAAAKQSPVWLYALAPANDALAHIATLPTVRATASLTDETLPFALLHELREEVRCRISLFARAGVSTLHEFRTAQDESNTESALHTLPKNSQSRLQAPTDHSHRIVLLLDDFHAFRDFASALSAGSDNPLTMLAEIMQRGPAVGVQTVVTALRPLGYAAGISSTISDSLIFRLAEQSDYQLAQIPKGLLDDAPPGRCVSAAQGVSCQILCLGAKLSLQGQATEIASLGAKLLDSAKVNTPQLLPLKDELFLNDLAQDLPAPVIGLTVPNLTPCTVPLGGCGVLSAPQDTLLQTAAHTICVSQRLWYAQTGQEHRRRDISLRVDAAAQLAVLLELERLLATDTAKQPQTIVLHDLAAVDDVEVSQKVCSVLQDWTNSPHTLLLTVRGEGKNLTWELQQQLRQLTYALSVCPFPGTVPAGFSSPLPETPQPHPAVLRGWLLYGAQKKALQIAIAQEENDAA